LVHAFSARGIRENGSNFVGPGADGLPVAVIAWDDGSRIQVIDIPQNHSLDQPEPGIVQLADKHTVATRPSVLHQFPTILLAST
jgi:hypothetical protein